MSDRLSRMSRKTATDDVEKDDDDDIERTITRTLWRNRRAHTPMKNRVHCACGVTLAAEGGAGRHVDSLGAATDLR